MKIFHALAACFAMILATAGIGALAQQPNAARPSGAPPAIVPESEQQLDPAAVSGPTIYVVDGQARLATINLGTFAVHFIGRDLGTVLTDIAFQPGTHKLYGVSFSKFYSVNTTTGRATPIGSGLGVNGANALVFNSLNVAYTAGVDLSSAPNLYKINVSTGRASIIGPMTGPAGRFCSLGDLAFYNDTFVLAGYKGCLGFGPTTPNYLVTLNEKTGAVIGTPVLLDACREIFGLVSTGKNELFALGIVPPGTTPALFKIVPTNPVGHRCELLKNLGKSGLGQIEGAAYDGNFQP
jgi:hypothetical protein